MRESAKIQEPSIGDTIHRPFFIAALATVLTLGCVWGAITRYPITGISGFIEVVGLTLWAYELVRNMRAGRELEKQTASESIVQLQRVAIR